MSVSVSMGATVSSASIRMNRGHRLSTHCSSYRAREPRTPEANRPTLGRSSRRLILLEQQNSRMHEARAAKGHSWMREHSCPRISVNGIYFFYEVATVGDPWPDPHPRRSFVGLRQSPRGHLRKPFAKQSVYSRRAVAALSSRHARAAETRTSKPTFLWPQHCGQFEPTSPRYRWKPS